MGCDIHGTIERKVDDKWVMVEPFPQDTRDRNYVRFALLAGVRGDGPTARGIPDDVSVSTKLHIDDWGVDGHSHSWLPLNEAAKIWLKTEWDKPSMAIDYPTSHYFDVDDDDPNEHRVVFWFDN